MYQELEYFSGTTGNAALYQAMLNPVLKTAKGTNAIMVNGRIIFIENVGHQPVKPTVDAEYVLIFENYTTKEFQVKKFESEKNATAAWHDCVRKISQLTPNAKQR